MTLFIIANHFAVSVFSLLLQKIPGYMIETTFVKYPIGDYYGKLMSNQIKLSIK